MTDKMRREFEAAPDALTNARLEYEAEMHTHIRMLQSRIADSERERHKLARQSADEPPIMSSGAHPEILNDNYRVKPTISERDEAWIKANQITRVRNDIVMTNEFVIPAEDVREYLRGKK